MEGGVDAADGLVGKSLAVLFLPEQTAILFEPGVELLMSPVVSLFSGMGPRFGMIC